MGLSFFYLKQKPSTSVSDINNLKIKMSATFNGSSDLSHNFHISTSTSAPTTYKISIRYNPPNVSQYMFM